MEIGFEQGGVQLALRFVLASQSWVIGRLILAAQSPCLLPVGCHGCGLCVAEREGETMEGKATQLLFGSLACRVLFRALDWTDVIHEKQPGRQAWACTSKLLCRERIKQIGISFLQATTARAPSTCRLLHHEALRLAGRGKQRPRHARHTQSTTNNTQDLEIWYLVPVGFFDRGDSCVTVVEFRSLGSPDSGTEPRKRAISTPAKISQETPSTSAWSPAAETEKSSRTGMGSAELGSWNEPSGEPCSFKEFDPQR